MLQPFRTTKHGFESQFGVNHLGHFAQTAQLIDLLNSTPSSRVVTISSIAHRFGQIEFDDLNWQHKSYDAMPAYGQSKLANQLFTYELQRKLSHLYEADDPSLWPTATNHTICIRRNACGPSLKP